jgi:hypothetical protein
MDFPAIVLLQVDGTHADADAKFSEMVSVIVPQALNYHEKQEERDYAKGRWYFERLYDRILEKKRWRIELLVENYRVSHIKCSTAHHERGRAACPRREQGKATLRRLAIVKIR